MYIIIIMIFEILVQAPALSTQSQAYRESNIYIKTLSQEAEYILRPLSYSIVDDTVQRLLV